MTFNDPHEPQLAAFIFSQDEADLVAAALLTPKPWDWEPGGAQQTMLKAVKTKILAHHKARQSEQCCYCRRNLLGAGPFMTDPEHILPKSKATYKPFAYTMWNLSSSCKRCNITIKNQDDAFVINKTDPNTFQQSGNYRLVHPNFDDWKDHLKIYSMQINERDLIVYGVIGASPKGEYTHNYFKLRELEKDTFNYAQGRPLSPGESEVIEQFRKLVEQFAQ